MEFFYWLSKHSGVLILLGGLIAQLFVNLFAFRSLLEWRKEMTDKMKELQSKVDSHLLDTGKHMDERWNKLQSQTVEDRLRRIEDAIKDVHTQLLGLYSRGNGGNNNARNNS